MSEAAGIDSVFWSEPLGITSARRTNLVPDLPTMMEAGVPDYEVITFNGIVAPAATPAAIVSKLNSALNEGLSTPVQSRTPRGYSVLDYLIAKYGYERAFAE